MVFLITLKLSRKTTPPFIFLYKWYKNSFIHWRIVRKGSWRLYRKVKIRSLRSFKSWGLNKFVFCALYNSWTNDSSVETFNLYNKNPFYRILYESKPTSNIVVPVIKPSLFYQKCKIVKSTQVASPNLSSHAVSLRGFELVKVSSLHVLFLPKLISSFECTKYFYKKIFIFPFIFVPYIYFTLLLFFEAILIESIHVFLLELSSFD